MKVPSTDCPAGWAVSTVGEVSVRIISGAGFPKHHQGQNEGCYPFAKVGDISRRYRGGHKTIKSADHYISDQLRNELNAKIFPKDTIVFPKIGEALRGNYRVICDRDMLFDNNVMGIAPDQRVIHAEYLYYFLLTQDFGEFAVATAVPSVRRGDVASIALSLPPINEQQRIVAKVEELFSELDDGVESLEKAREQLKVYRQALLRDAFEGKLTAHWRAKNKDKLETAEQLLDRISREREDRYEQEIRAWKAEVKAWEANARPGRKPSKPRKPERFSLEEKVLFDLPDGWTWECVGNLNVEIFDGPFGSNLKTSDYVDAGVRVIRLENIGYSKFIEEKRSYVTQEKYEGIRKHTVSAGDIIFSSFVTDGVRAAILPDSIKTAVNKADCFCVRLHGDSFHKDFLLHFLGTRAAYKQLEAEIHGIGRPRINTTQLKCFAVPVCGVEEQDEIMKRLSEKLSLVENAELFIEQEMQKTVSLRQGILKKAFSGQLVAQDSNDEPAWALLERIRSEKEKDAGANGRRRKDAA